MRVFLCTVSAHCLVLVIAKCIVWVKDLNINADLQLSLLYQLNSKVKDCTGKKNVMFMDTKKKCTYLASKISFIGIIFAERKLEVR